MKTINSFIQYLKSHRLLITVIPAETSDLLNQYSKINYKVKKSKLVRDLLRSGLETLSKSGFYNL